jgi:hypothetical protein
LFPPQRPIHRSAEKIGGAGSGFARAFSSSLES